jgi:ATP-binding cassette subfamily A (ABC1) protein 3
MHRVCVAVFSRAIDKNYGFALYVQQFHGMLVKRMLHTARNLLLAASQLLIPLLFVIVALTVIRTLPGPEDSPPLTLNMSYFRDNTVVYGGVGGSAQELAEVYAWQYRSDAYPDIDTRDVARQPGFHNKTVEEYLVYQAERSISTYNSKYLIAAHFTSVSGNANKTLATAFFNNQAFHTPGITLNAIDTAVLKRATSDPRATIATTNHPLPRTVKEQVRSLVPSHTLVHSYIACYIVHLCMLIYVYRKEMCQLTCSI